MQFTNQIPKFNRFLKKAHADAIQLTFVEDDATKFNTICEGGFSPDFEKDFPYFVNWIGENIRVSIKTHGEDRGEHFGTPAQEEMSEAEIHPKNISIDFTSVIRFEDCIPKQIITESSDGIEVILGNLSKEGPVFMYEVGLG